MIPGTKIKLGDKEYTVPPMNFSTLIKVAPLLKSFEAIMTRASLPSDEEFKNVVTILQLAINRNYPEVTFEQVADALDMQNMTEIMNGIMSGSGTVTQGEAKADSH